MNVKFYIFGAPEIFDLFVGDTEAISYFQTLDDGSNENVKFTIHRSANKDVSYSYLRYKFISGSGRTGSFFGMSVVFNGQYCHNTIKLYRLFDSVYRDVILKNNSLISEIKDSEQVQARFLVRKFNERDDEARNIENIILKNLETAFTTDDIRAIDSSFKQGKPNVIRKMNIYSDRKMNIYIDNGIISNALRNYSWVSISPDYADEIIDEIDKDRIEILNREFKEIIYFIVESYVKLMSSRDIATNKINIYDKTIANNLDEIKNYIKNQPKLEEFKEDYFKLQNLLKTLKSTVNSKKANNKERDIGDSKEPIEKVEEQEQIKEEDSKTPDKSIKISWFKKLFGKNTKLKYAVIVGIPILIIAPLLFWLKPLSVGVSSVDIKDCPQCLVYEDNFDNFLSKNKFDSAWNELEKLKLENQKITEKQSLLIERVKSEANSLIEKNTIEDLKEAKELLEHSVQYENKDIEQDTISIALKIKSLMGKNIPASIEPITNNNSSNSQETSNDQSTRAKGQNIEDCRVKYEEKTKKATDWYLIFETEFKKKNFDYVIKGCSVIINNCLGDIKAKAELLKKQAKAEKEQRNAIKKR